MRSPTTVTGGGGLAGPGGGAQRCRRRAPRGAGSDAASWTTMPSACLGCRNASCHSGFESSWPTIVYPAASARSQAGRRRGTRNVT